MSDASAPNLSLDDPGDAVEALWAQSGDAPDLKAFLADRPHWLLNELRAALLVDQEFRSRTSQPWSVEEYSALVPNLVVDNDVTLDLIFGEVRGRSRQGHPPNLQELSVRFPHLKQQLERQLDILSWFEDGSNSDFVPDNDDSPGEAPAGAIRFGDYELHEEVARGGMGVIFRATHRKLKRTVALKMVRPERLMRAADLRRFKSETRIIARLDHPNIIDILNVDSVDGVHFFTMRMVEGRDLNQRRSEYLDNLRLAARLVSSVALAIHHAHQHGVLHRDLKPSNVLVDNSGNPFIVDFGLASRLPEPGSLAESDEFCGTPAYAAPELLQVHSHPPTIAADVYGLGAILYVLITGRPPFGGSDSFEFLNKIRESEPPPPRLLNARVDPDLEAICLKALAKNPAARYSGAASLAEDLDRYLARKPVAARPIGWWQRRGRWLRKHPIGPALAMVAAAVAFSLLAIIAIQSSAMKDLQEKISAARKEAETLRQALQMAQEKAASRQAGTVEDRRQPSNAP